MTARARRPRAGAGRAARSVCGAKFGERVPRERGRSRSAPLGRVVSVSGSRAVVAVGIRRRSAAEPGRSALRRQAARDRGRAVVDGRAHLRGRGGRTEPPEHDARERSSCRARSALDATGRERLRPRHPHLSAGRRRRARDGHRRRSRRSTTTPASRRSRSASSARTTRSRRRSASRIFCRSISPCSARRVAASRAPWRCSSTASSKATEFDARAADRPAQRVCAPPSRKRRRSSARARSACRSGCSISRRSSTSSIAGGRASTEEVELLADLIPLAKARYAQGGGAQRSARWCRKDVRRRRLHGRIRRSHTGSATSSR